MVLILLCNIREKMVALAAKMLPIMVGAHSVRTVTDSVLPSPMISEMVLAQVSPTLIPDVLMLRTS